MKNKLSELYSIVINKLPKHKVMPRQDEAFGVNYVWINEKSEAQENTMCSVPLHYLDRAYENARKYPNAEFIIWIDKAMIDPLSDFFVASHGYLSAPDNVSFKNLRDIPSVNESKVFDIDQPQDIWARTDLARLLMLKHKLELSEKLYQLYADFDVPDVMLGDQHMLRHLERFGMFYGTTFKTDMIENGYMCFDKERGAAFLGEAILPATIKQAEKGKNGWSSLRDAYHAWTITQNFVIKRGKATGQRQEWTGTPLPDDPKYRAMGLNGKPAAPCEEAPPAFEYP